MMQQLKLDYKNYQHSNLTSLVGGKQGRLRSNIFKGQYCSAFSIAVSTPTFPNVIQTWYEDVFLMGWVILYYLKKVQLNYYRCLDILHAKS